MLNKVDWASLLAELERLPSTPLERALAIESIVERLSTDGGPQEQITPQASRVLMNVPRELRSTSAGVGPGEGRRDAS